MTSSATVPYPPATFLSDSQPASTVKGPNQTWESMLPNGRANILGDGTAVPKAMWRWQKVFYKTIKNDVIVLTDERIS